MFNDNMTPNLNETAFEVPEKPRQFTSVIEHQPRILLLYGSLRAGSFSRYLIEESARLLELMGTEVKVFHPEGLPLFGSVAETNEKIIELHELVLWSEGQVWCSPELHGTMSSVMKTQLDWIPHVIDEAKTVQGKTLALLEICGGGQSFNVINQMRVSASWLKMLSISGHLSLPFVDKEFDETQRLLPSDRYDNLVDTMEELVKLTLLTRGNRQYLLDSYSKRILQEK